MMKDEKFIKKEMENLFKAMSDNIEDYAKKFNINITELENILKSNVETYIRKIKKTNKKKMIKTMIEKQEGTPIFEEDIIMDEIMENEKEETK